MRKALKITGIFLGVTFLASVMFVGAIGYFLFYGSIDFEPSSFDSDAWKASKPEMTWNSLRLKMVDDLMESHLYNNQSKASVIALIGEPDDTKYFDNYDMVYYLGRERSGLGVDSEWLVFKLKNNAVQNFRLVAD